MSDGKHFSHTVTVRFHEVDRAGILFFGRVFEYCHVAFEEMMAAHAGGGLPHVFDDLGWGMPLVHAEADYERPMRMGDQIRVDMSVERIGSSSLTFGFELIGADGRRHATVRLVHAFTDLNRLAKRGVPPEIPDVCRRAGLL